MELEYKDPSRKGRWIVIAGVALAIVAGGAAFLLVNNAQQQAGQGEIKYVVGVVAAKDLAARKAIEAADILVRQDIPLDGTNAVGLVTDPATLVGRLLAVDVKAGQLITSNLLVSTTAGAQFSILRPDETVAPDSEYWRAVSVTVADDQAVGGFLGPGMVVDVIVSTGTTVVEPEVDESAAPVASPSRPPFYSDRTTKIMYQNVLILARQGAFYILKAPLQVAEEIGHLQASGTATFAFALRPDQDTRYLDVSRLGATTNRILQRYGFPIPESWPNPNPDAPIPSNPPIPAITPPPTPSPTPVPSPSPSG